MKKLKYIIGGATFLVGAGIAVYTKLKNNKAQTIKPKTNLQDDEDFEDPFSEIYKETTGYHTGTPEYEELERTKKKETIENGKQIAEKLNTKKEEFIKLYELDDIKFHFVFSDTYKIIIEVIYKQQRVESYLYIEYENTFNSIFGRIQHNIFSLKEQIDDITLNSKAQIILNYLFENELKCYVSLYQHIFKPSNKKIIEFFEEHYPDVKFDWK